MATFVKRCQAVQNFGWAKLDADEGTWTARLYAGVRSDPKPMPTHGSHVAERAREWWL